MGWDGREGGMGIKFLLKEGEKGTMLFYCGLIYLPPSLEYLFIIGFAAPHL